MNVITLTADELARWERGERTWIEPGEPGRPAMEHRVEGGSLSCSYCNRTFTFNFMRDRGPFECSCARSKEARKIAATIAPPVRWRDAVGPCPKCRGRGFRWTLKETVGSTFHHPRSDFFKVRCSDCRGTGKLLTELRATCPECGGDATDGWLDHCDDGSVLVATVNVEVLPIALAWLWLHIDPPPVIGRDFAIVLTEVPT